MESDGCVELEEVVVVVVLVVVVVVFVDVVVVVVVELVLVVDTTEDSEDVGEVEETIAEDVAVLCVDAIVFVVVELVKLALLPTPVVKLECGAVDVAMEEDVLEFSAGGGGKRVLEPWR